MAFQNLQLLFPEKSVFFCNGSDNFLYLKKKKKRNCEFLPVLTWTRQIRRSRRQHFEGAVVITKSTWLWCANDLGPIQPNHGPCGTYYPVPVAQILSAVKCQSSYFNDNNLVNALKPAYPFWNFQIPSNTFHFPCNKN